MWKLKRTVQCEKCPWRKGVNPHDIPNGYSPTKHAALSSTIAAPGDLSALFDGLPHRAMACHETQDSHCIGWLVHQIGAGNNIGLRMLMMSCENGRDIRLQGDQHDTFEDTLPKDDL